MAENDPVKAPPGARVEAVDEVTDEVVASLAHLVPQVSSAVPPSRSWLAEMLADPGTTLLVARGGDGAILGTLTLSVTRLLTGVRAFVEDVVVDGPARGQGVGTALVREALRRAALAGARTVDLTSRPEREAANRLYGNLGFRRRDTNVYRYTL